ncbi:hypothetical protein PVK06_004991 [Gossypium arboreum]|uniref:Uncharacterized protein n=1 Tax=Gossypium arboreum TaxID=29729 RepID=A0ABR0QUD2_GOSAR|nr:hypothetical protein PVK06_004991 [Gossypium arboreum]
MELSEVKFGLEKIIVVLGGKEFIGGQNSVGMKVLLPVLEKQVNSFLLEAKTSKSKAEELGTKLAGSQKVVNELSTKGSFGKNPISSAPLAAHGIRWSGSKQSSQSKARPHCLLSSPAYMATRNRFITKRVIFNPLDILSDATIASWIYMKSQRM